MKKIGLLIICIFFGITWACENPSIDDPAIPNPTIISPTIKKCNLIAYQDSVFYVNNYKSDLKIKPLVERKGFYGGIPEGLEINKGNGEINVTKSESGLKYQVYFIPENTIDTCFTEITISGVDYLSKIYILAKNEKIAVPIYNNNPSLIIPGSANNGKTEFDDGEDDDNDDGDADEPLAGQELIPQGLDISKKDGKIELNNSLKNGFISKETKSGDSRKAILYYRIDDKSGKNLNKLEIEFHYYDKESEVPKSLKEKILQNQSSYFYEELFRNSRIFRIIRRPRPPHIVIVGRT